MPIDRIWAIFGSSFGLFDWCLCFFRHPSLSLVPFIPDQPPTFRSKNLFSRGKNIFSFCFFCAPFGSLLRARTIIYTLPFVFFLGRESFSSGAVFLSNRLKKDFERFVCKEKRRTFVTAKAIAARLIEELFRRARRDSFFGGDQATSFFLSVSPEKRVD